MADLRKFYSLQKRIDSLNEDKGNVFEIYLYDILDNGTVQFYEYSTPEDIQTVTLEEWNEKEAKDRSEGKVITLSEDQ